MYYCEFLKKFWGMIPTIYKLYMTNIINTEKKIS